MRWVTKNYKGERQVWYSEDVIRKIKQECQEAIDTYNNEEFYEDDCDIFQGESLMAERILNIIQEWER